MTAMSNFMENKLIDFLLRAQALGITGGTAAAGTGPALTYIALFTTAPTDAGGGTEVSGNAYARVPVTSALANWAGTQSAGSTTASTGTSGTTSNNGAVTFPTPTPLDWGTVVAVGIFDALTGGNLLLWGNLSASVPTNTSSPPTFAPGALQFQIDN